MREITKTPMTREDVKVIETVAEVRRSRTQSIRVDIVEVRGDRMVSFQKWWRESPEDEWTAGKGFHLRRDEVETILPGLEDAIKKLA